MKESFYRDYPYDSTKAKKMKPYTYLSSISDDMSKGQKSSRNLNIPNIHLEPTQTYSRPSLMSAHAPTGNVQRCYEEIKPYTEPEVVTSIRKNIQDDVESRYSVHSEYMNPPVTRSYYEPHHKLLPNTDLELHQEEFPRLREKLERLNKNMVMKGELKAMEASLRSMVEAMFLGWKADMDKKLARRTERTFVDTGTELPGNFKNLIKEIERRSLKDRLDIANVRDKLSTEIKYLKSWVKDEFKTFGREQDRLHNEMMTEFKRQIPDSIPSMKEATGVSDDKQVKKLLENYERQLQELVRVNDNKTKDFMNRSGGILKDFTMKSDKFLEEIRNKYETQLKELARNKESQVKNLPKKELEEDKLKANNEVLIKKLNDNDKQLKNLLQNTDKKLSKDIESLKEQFEERDDQLKTLVKDNDKKLNELRNTNEQKMKDLILIVNKNKIEESIKTIVTDEKEEIEYNVKQMIDRTEKQLNDLQTKYINDIKAISKKIDKNNTQLEENIQDKNMNLRELIQRNENRIRDLADKVERDFKILEEAIRREDVSKKSSKEPEKLSEKASVEMMKRLDTNEACLKDISRDNERMKEILVELEKQLKNDVKRLKESEDQLLDRVEGTEQSLDMLSNKLATLVSDLDKKHEESKQIKALEKKVNQNEAQIKEAANKINNKRFVDENQVKCLMEDTNTQLKLHSDKIEKLESKVKDNENQLKDLEKSKSIKMATDSTSDKHNEYEEVIKNIQKKIAENKNKIEELISRSKDDIDTIEALKEEKKENDERIDKILEDQNVAKQNLKSIQVNAAELVNKMESRISEVVEKIQLQTNSIEKLQRDQEQTKKSLDEVIENNYNEAIAKLENDIEVVMNKLNKNGQQLNDLKDNIAKNLNDSKNQVNILKENILKQVQEVANRTDEQVNSMRNNINILEDNIDTNRDQLIDSLDVLRKELDNLTTKLEEDVKRSNDLIVEREKKPKAKEDDGKVEVNSEEVDNLKKQLSEQQRQLDSFRDEMSKKKSNDKKLNESLQNSNTRIKEVMGKLETYSSQTKAELDNLKKELNNNKDRNQIIDELRKRLDNDEEKHKIDVNELKDKVEDSEKQLKVAIEDVKKKASNNEKKNKADFNTLNTEIQADIDKLKQKLNEADIKINKQATLYDSLFQKLSENITASDITDKKNIENYTELKKKLDKISKDTNTNHSNTAKLLEAINEQLNDLKNKYESLSPSVESNDIQIKQLVDECNRQFKEVEDRETKLKELINEHIIKMQDGEKTEKKDKKISDELDKKLNELQKAITESNSRINELTTTSQDELEKAKHEINEKLVELEKNLSKSITTERESKMTKLMKSIDDHDKVLAELRKSLEEINTKLNVNEEQKNKVIEDINNKLGHISDPSLVEEMKKSLSELQNDLNEFKLKCDSQIEDISSKDPTSQIKKLVEEFNELDEIIIDVREKIAEIEDALKINENKLKTVPDVNAIKELEDSITANNKKLNALQETVETLKNKSNEAEKLLKKKTKGGDSEEGIIRGVKSKLAEQESKLKEHENKLNEFQRSSEDLVHKLEENEAVINRVLGNNESTSKEVEHNKKNFEELEKNLNAQENKLNQLKIDFVNMLNETEIKTEESIEKVEKGLAETLNNSHIEDLKEKLNMNLDSFKSFENITNNSLMEIEKKLSMLEDKLSKEKAEDHEEDKASDIQLKEEGLVIESRKKQDVNNTSSVADDIKNSIEKEFVLLDRIKDAVELMKNRIDLLKEEVSNAATKKIVKDETISKEEAKQFATKKHLSSLEKELKSDLEALRKKLSKFETNIEDKVESLIDIRNDDVDILESKIHSLKENMAASEALRNSRIELDERQEEAKHRNSNITPLDLDRIHSANVVNINLESKANETVEALSQRVAKLEHKTKDDIECLADIMSDDIDILENKISSLKGIISRNDLIRSADVSKIRLDEDRQKDSVIFESDLFKREQFSSNENVIDLNKKFEDLFEENRMLKNSLEELNMRNKECIKTITETILKPEPILDNSSSELTFQEKINRKIAAMELVNHNTHSEIQHQLKQLNEKTSHLNDSIISKITQLLAQFENHNKKVLTRIGTLHSVSEPSSLGKDRNVLPHHKTHLKVDPKLQVHSAKKSDIGSTGKELPQRLAYRSMTEDNVFKEDDEHSHEKASAKLPAEELKKTQLYSPDSARLGSGRLPESLFEDVESKIGDSNEPNFNLSEPFKGIEETVGDVKESHGALLSSNGLCDDNSEQKILDA